MAVAVSKETSGSPVKRKAPTHAHPKYIDMVVTAIESLEGGKKGSSNQAITKYVTENFDVASNVKTHINNALKKGVEDKLLVQIHGVGATGSFRLATSSKKRSKSVTSEASDDAPPPKKVKSPAKQAKKAKSPANKDKSPAKSAAKKAQSPNSKGKKGAEAAAKKIAKKTGPAKSKSKSASPAKVPKSKTAAAKPAKSKGSAPKKAFAKKE
uniref:H15 domain-containing protein n=1 Tax=Ditylenchus dipsaci TaxID=166011 RepID=A0A915EA66_9BILA